MFQENQHHKEHGKNPTKDEHNCSKKTEDIEKETENPDKDYKEIEIKSDPESDDFLDINEWTLDEERKKR